MILVDNGVKRLVLAGLGSKGQDGGGAAGNGRARTGLEIIASGRIVLVKVDVRIDAARGDESTVGVNELCGGKERGQVLAEKQDFPLADSDVLFWKDI